MEVGNKLAGTEEVVSLDRGTLNLPKDLRSQNLSIEQLSMCRDPVDRHVVGGNNK